jgi:phage portal protein BeeE
VGLLERVADARGGDRGGAGDERRFGVDAWVSDYLIPAAGGLVYGGHAYGPGGLVTTYGQQHIAQILATLPGYAAALRGSPPAFAAQLVRALVLSQIRFTFRNVPWHPRTPRRLFSNADLAKLERPWPNATTGDLVGLCEWHAGLAGNAFVADRGERLRVLRPDWVGILYGSQREPDDPTLAIDADLLGYVYWNGGQGGGAKPVTLLPGEVAHWTPIVDPEQPGLGQSWITPAVKEIQGDQAATQHKLTFFANGATPNLVVKGIPARNREEFDAAVEMLEENHAGVANAYRTLYLTAGADATVVGSDLKQLDFKATQGAGETRIALLSRVPAPILGIAEGLAGSSLNAGNFGMARRIFADSWVFPTAQSLANSLAKLIKVPADSELWFDTTDVPLLREDAKDAAEITEIQARTIANLVKEGFTPESAKAAVLGQNMALLVHTGLVSVQLQVPGSQPAKDSGGGKAPAEVGKKPPAKAAAK